MDMRKDGKDMHQLTDLPAWERLMKKIAWKQLGDIKGKKILDFWATVGMNYAVPPVEWYGGNSFGGTSQLRKLCDGYEALLDAYLYGKANGETNDLWKKALDSFADVLVSLQNSDGSF